jgi:hypothetical protein
VGTRQSRHPSKLASATREKMVAKIISMRRSSYISEQRSSGGFVDDEAMIELVGEIAFISKRHKKEIGKPIDITLACARRFENEGPPTNRPFLVMMNLRKDQRSLMAYLPADAFWGMPAVLSSDQECCIEAWFEPTRSGSGALLSLWLGPFADLPDQEFC